MERERVSLGDGVSIYRQYNTWSLEIHQSHKRDRSSLGTKEKGVALMIASNVLASLREQKQSIVFAMRPINPKWSKLPPESLLYQIWAGAQTLANTAKAGADLQAVIRDAVRAEVGKEAVPSISVDQAREEYISSKTKKLRVSRHVSNIESSLRSLIESARVPDVAQITTDHVNAWYEKQLTFVVPKTANDRLAHISAWLAWCKRVKKYVADNVAEGIEKADPEDREVCYHTSEELIRILDAAKGHDKEDLILFALYSGMRAGELGRVNAEDVNVKEQTIRIRHRTKTKKNRWAPLMDDLLPVILRLPRTGKLFPFSINSGATNRSLDKVWLKAKISTTKYECGLQVLRHSWVTHNLHRELSKATLAQWAGHTVEVQENDYHGIFKPGDTPFPMTCPKHGIGKTLREAKIND